jgi:magnesium chelatase subunit D
LTYNKDFPADSAAELQSPPAIEASFPKLRLTIDSTKAERSSKVTPSSRQRTVKHAVGNQQRGRYARSVRFKTAGAKIALDATLRALLASSFRASDSNVLTSPERETRLPVLSDGLRFKLFKRKQGTLFIFAIDTSGSMALNRIARAKGAITKLLRQSYLNRDSVAIVSFRGRSAEIALPPSRSVLRARRVLDSLKMGGSTPLSAGLVALLQLVKRERDRQGETVGLLFTDGHANVPLHSKGNSEYVPRQQIIESELTQLGAALKKAGFSLTIVDTQRGYSIDSDTKRLAEVLRAHFVG